MGFNIFRIFAIPIIISFFFIDLNNESNNLNANVNNMPAKKNDLDLYHGMGVSFLCNATRKGFDLDFPKTLNVASATFASVVLQKHGGKIIEKKKEQTVDMKQLQFIASLQLVDSALQVCPDNVPEKIKKQFQIESERLKKLQGL
ncbi:Villin headpiece domain-containing protein [Prochlorococcus marinus XMU1410]|uniref:Villin headpiece domain-containing protein n=1 Tax=Prochlorococcus marinus TaxID=1219 RepID=UPI001ADA0FE0|nr:Villin headpiece domain-containing protein [Prochlorococcus marinus]MBO8242142.1 Villin headpiece domain-containing protein [Prochlorococcus marinus XMU1410]